MLFSFRHFIPLRNRIISRIQNIIKKSQVVFKLNCIYKQKDTIFIIIVLYTNQSFVTKITYGQNRRFCLIKV